MFHVGFGVISINWSFVNQLVAAAGGGLRA
jgi:hypothetical protein